MERNFTYLEITIQYTCAFQNEGIFINLGTAAFKFLACISFRRDILTVQTNLGAGDYFV